MAMYRFTRIERITIATPLGIRFWDAALERPVADGLVATAWPLADPRALVRATLTASGVYAFHGMPRVRSAEYPADGAEPASPPPLEPFVVVVDDRLGRFVPVAFTAEVPYRGIFPTEHGGSPAGRPPGFYLFASPSRPTTAELAVVRAQLVDESGAAAANAVLEVEGPDGSVRYGLADARGAAAVMFPYPPFPIEEPGSPPRSPAEVRQPPRWAIQVRARYRRASQSALPGARQPDLASLFAQAPANILAAGDAAPVPALPADLVFGTEAVLRTGTGSTLVLSAP